MKKYGENTIDLLNVGIDDFYNYHVDFIKDSKVIEFKAIFITFMNQLERVFNGVFGKPFQISTEEDLVLFKKLYPFIYKIATKEKGKDGITKLCAALVHFRNLNAHASCGSDYKNIFDLGFILKEIPNYNPNVKYLTEDGIPTLGGMISLLFFLSNDRAIEYFIKSDVWKGFAEHLNYFGNKYIPDMRSFPEMVMNVNKIKDEIDIRSNDKAKTILEAISGRFLNDLSENGAEFFYQNGEDDEDSTYHIAFRLEENGMGGYHLMVHEKSNYHKFFPNEYHLTIVDVKGFIELSKQVPPFMLVVYLYRAGIDAFENNTLSEKEIEMVLKLNKPKFYFDKNVDTLLLSSNVSDIRMGGQILSISVNYCLYMFELKSLNGYRYYGVGKYSRLKTSLEHSGLSSGLIDRLVAIRNFFSHYYLLGDEHVVGKGYAKIDLDYVLATFEEFGLELKETNPQKSEHVYNDLFYRIVCTLLLFKYSDFERKTKEFLDNPNEPKSTALFKTYGRVKNSFVTESTERFIKSIFGEKEFNFGEERIAHFYKTTIKSIRGIEFFNGFVSKYEINLLSNKHFDINQYLVAHATLVSKKQNGFIIETIYSVD